MLLDKILLPPLAILLLGMFGLERLKRKKFYEFTIYELFTQSLVIGSFFLIYPMTIVGVFLNKRLFHVVYLYYAIALLIGIYYIITITVNIKPSLIIKPEKFKQKTDYRIYSVILFFIIIGYTFLNIVYPPRGWDALQFYLPNALFFYLEDDIVASNNPFTFFPSFKPPSNVLFYTYSYYTTGGFYAQLFPIMFIVGLAFVTIEFAMDLGLSKKYAVVASILMITTPAFYSMILEYIYYQDLIVAFFFSFGIIYLNKAKSNRSQSDNILATMSFTLAVLSKLSGFTFPVVIIASFVLLNQKYDKIFRVGIIGLLSLFLAYKASSDIYIGTGFIIIIIGILLIYQILTINQSNQIDENNSSRLQKSNLVLISSAYILTVGIWLFHMNKFPNVTETLRNLYFNRSSEGFRFSFPKINSIFEIYLENAQKSSFFLSVLTILLASQFTLFLLIPKLIGIKSSYKKYPILNLWVGSFYMLWLAFHSTTSIRYLSVIWIPLSILIVIGLKEIINYFKLKEVEDLVLLLSIVVNFLFYFPFLPLEFIADDFHLRMYNYHTGLIRLLIYVLVFSIIMRFIFVRIVMSHTKFSNGKIMIYNIIKFTLMTIIIIAPISFQFGILATNGFDIQEFRNEYSYDNRESVMDMIDFMSDLNYEVDIITIGVNVPGFAFYLKRPVLDLMFVDPYIEEEDLQILANENSTALFEDMIENNIHYIIKLLPDHAYYEIYVDSFVSKYPFFSFINSSNSNFLHSNNEFELWEINE